QLNVLWTPPGRIERQLESHPWIQDAQVARVLPSTLTVVITERRPVAVDPSSRAVVAPDGTILAKGSHPGALPLIETPAGLSPSVARRLTANGVQVARALSGAVLSRVDRIAVSDLGDVELQLKSGTTVVYGQPVQASVKAAVLEAMLRWSYRNHSRARSIDLSIPAVPSMVPMQPLQPAA
ncbi:MAG TPA: FtsQ-type POTRA domain-containing protein, partial [Actinomycetota bacterium]